MADSCSIQGCANIPLGPGISFHLFPKQTKPKKIWGFKLRREERCTKTKSSIGVCAKHFLQSDFRVTFHGKGRCLKKNATRSLFLCNPANHTISRRRFRDPSIISIHVHQQDFTMNDENEPPLDPKAISTRPTLSQYDLEDHRCTVYIGYYVPNYRRKSHYRRNHRHHHHRSSFSSGAECAHDISKPITPPSERVQFILGEEEEGGHELHPLFSEMEELFYDGNDVEWRETARWIKFEEDVEEGGNRWSKPHVATVSLHSLFELRSCILNGSIILDMVCQEWEEVVDSVLDDMESHQLIPSNSRERVKKILLRPHRHQHELNNEWGDKSSRLPLIRSFTEVGRNSSKISTHHVLSIRDSFTPHMSSVLEEKTHSSAGNSASAGALGDHIIHNLSSLSFRGMSSGKSGSSPDESSSEVVLHRNNQSFMRKIPPRAEASNILVGELECLDKLVTSLVRLNESTKLGDLTEVPVPSRFIFMVLGPPGYGLRYHEIGRAMATLLSDEVFHGVAYKGKTRSDLLAGVDEYLDATTVLPPGVWDPATRIEPPEQTASQESRKKPDPKKNESVESSDEIESTHNFVGSGRNRIFGELIDDVQRKAHWYLSDFKDLLALQCISSIVFLYFACIAQIITFGGLLAHATEDRIAGSECLLAALICGVVYSLCSGQPLTLLGSTGPVLVYESILFDLSKKFSFDYLSMRVWIGLWTSLYILILVASNVTILVRYITRFTEEIFATLISVFFVYKAFTNIFQIEEKFPMTTGFRPPPVPMCLCQSPISANFTSVNFTSVISESQCQSLNGISVPSGCSYTPPFYVPNVFLMSIILFIGTFALILLLREMKNTSFFASKVRIAIADFSVLGAVVAMTVTDYFAGLNTPKLDVPRTFRPTIPGRDWLIPFIGSNPWWFIPFASIPALILTISVFMDHQITTVIVNRKENKLKKGCGYHLDLFILAILITICSIFGLPWFVAATVLSITHVNSLKYASKCSAPGEKPRFLGVREQRMTHFMVYLLIGLSFFFTDVLQFIPMPVLYGVFLFMGVTALKGLQLSERIMIMFMPEKYQPDYRYLRRVPISRVRVYTCLQLILFGILFCCKLFKITAVVLPFLLIGIIIVRKCLVCVFDKTHLKMLDDVVPEATEFKKDDNSTADQNSSSLSDVVCIDGESSKSTMNNVNSHANINISEVLTQSSIWKSINQQSNKATKRFLVSKTKKKKRSKRDATKSEEHRRLSVMEEEEEDNPTSSSVSPSVPSESVSPESKTGTDI